MSMKRKWKKALVISAGVLGTVVVSGGVAGFTAYEMGWGPFAPLQADMKIDAAMRTAVIEGAIADIEHYYVFADKVPGIARHLREMMQRGDFDAITSAEKLAATLSDVLQQETGDAHFALRYFEKPIAELPPGEDQTAEEKAEEASNQKRLNYGVRTVQRLKSNIGYLDLHAFGRPGPSAAKLAGAMAVLSDTRALIVDLRECGGGDPETVMLLANYFFEVPTHLNDIQWREGNRIEQRWTQPAAAGLNYGSTRKLYVLTGAETFSACEDFAYALKSNRRATIVGTPSQGGGAHPGQPRRINAHFMIFVPTGRAINPLTHANWQATGVVPDLPSSEDRALNVAQIEVNKEVMATDPDPRARQAAKDQIAELD